MISTPLRMVGTAAGALLILSGCGGGGGGDGGGAATLTMSPAAITFTANHDDPNPPAAQTVTVTTNRGGTTYFQFENGGTKGLSCGGSSCTFEVQPDAPYSYVNPGTTSDAVTVVGCADPLCASPVGRATVTWTYTIAAGTNVTPDPGPYASGVEGVASAPIEFTLTHPSGTVPSWQASFTQGSPATNNPIAVSFSQSSSPTPSPSGATFQVQVAPIAQIGTFTGWIEVRPGGGPRTIRRLLTYQVVPALNLLTTTGFTINGSSTSASLQKVITIGSNLQGATPLDWSATEDSAWLEISPASGNTMTGSQLTLSLVRNTLEHLPKGIHHASVIVSSPTDPMASPPQPTRTPVTIDVVLDMQLPLASYAMPPVVLTGAAGETYIRGSGFSSLPGTVSFGGSPATSVNRVDDTLIRANHAAFNSAGTYAIDLGIESNVLLLNRSRTRVVAITQSAYAAANFASPGEKYAAVFDDQRNALYVANVEPGGEAIERYRYSNGAWTMDSLAVASLKDIALTADAAQLLALTPNGFKRVDPVGFTVIDTIGVPYSAIPNRTFAVANDGQVSFTRAGDLGATSGGRYDLNLGILTEELNCCANRYVRASGDGSVLYFVEAFSSVYRQNTRTREFASSPAFSTAPTSLSVSRDGSRLLIDATRLIDSSFNAITTLATGGEALAASVLTQDGKRAHAVANSGTLYTFNVDVAPNSPATLIGSPITLPASVGANPQMAVSLDGRTVFIAGDARVIVQPGPP